MPICSADHEWESIYTWYARYKCKKCGVLAYRGIVLGTACPRDKRASIILYRCSKCSGPTTRWAKNRHLACDACEEKKRSRVRGSGSASVLVGSP